MCHIYIVTPLVPLLISPNDIPEIILKIKNCRRDVMMQIQMTNKIKCTMTVKKRCFNLYGLKIDYFELNSFLKCFFELV